MFETIVWASDGSDSADRALDYAKELATSNGGKLLAVHVAAHYATGRGAGLPVYVDEGDVGTKLGGQIDAAREEGVDAKLFTVNTSAGRVPHAIAEFAESEGADVLVLGTRGHSPLAGVLLGSVTQSLLRLAPCPVLAVPPTAVHAHAGA